MEPLILPLEQAIVAAAYQNLVTDHKNDPEGTCPWSVYLEEAEYLLKESGENYLPPTGHPHVKLLTFP